ncbi:MAG: PstS family phosphate ABC transporter substrate-binding protein [Firmicutes bacterium]|nr:PstS family phosphate ABC transporter substrate-binding protein [Bacillota bacterium]
MGKKIVILMVAVVVVVLSGCGNNNGDGYLEIKGSDTMVNLGQQWADTYMDANSEVSLAVTGGGSGTGIAGLLNDNLDIAQSSRKITQEELDAAAQKNLDVYEFVVGQDAISVIVNDANPVAELTMDELKQIFTGEITQWAQLGWEEGGAISLYSRQSNSGTHVFFWETVLNQADWATNTMFMPGTSSIYEGVAADRDAIGYVGVAYVNHGVHAVNVGLDKTGPFIDPTIRANVDSGKYPIARPLYFYVNGKPEGAVLDYLQWVLSAEGIDVLETVGFYRNSPEYEQANANLFQALDLK